MELWSYGAHCYGPSSLASSLLFAQAPVDIILHETGEISLKLPYTAPSKYSHSLKAP